MRVLILMTSLTWWYGALAAVPLPRCHRLLTDAAPAFDRDITLDAHLSQVTYRGESFWLPPNQYYLLQLVLAAPREVASFDDLVIGMWDVHEPDYAETAIKVLVHRLRLKFKTIDPEFDRLLSKLKTGFYWKRESYQKTVRGRVGVAKNILEGYADGQTLSLTPKEHALITALFRRTYVTATTVDVGQKQTFEAAVCRLNRKFQAILGVRLTSPGPRGLNAFTLNKAVYDH